MAHDPHLTARQRTGLSVPPLLLRLVLAAIFIWAGYAKCFGTFDVTDENRAALVAAGVLTESGAVIDPVPDVDVEDLIPEPEPESEPEPEVIPEEDPAEDPQPVSPVEPGPGSDDPPSDPGLDEPGLDEPGEALLVAQTEPAATKVRMANNIAMALHAAAHPEPVTDDQGVTKTPMALVPDALGSPPWAVRLAWAAAITELVAGILLLVGLFSRLGGLAVAWIMGVAIWLTAIGPAIQSGDAFLGFLPQPDLVMTNYKDMFYQLALLAMGLAIAFSGGGMLSVDRFIFGKGAADDED